MRREPIRVNLWTNIPAQEVFVFVCPWHIYFFLILINDHSLECKLKYNLIVMKVSSSNHVILHMCQRRLTGCVLPFLFFSEISEEAEHTERRASTNWKAMVSIFL